MRTMAWIISLFLCLILASGLIAQQQQIAVNDNLVQSKNITLTLKDTPLKMALEALFKGSGYTFEFASIPESQNTQSLKQWWEGTSVNANLNNVTFDEAVKILSRASGLDYEIRDSTQQAGKDKIVIYIFRPAVRLSFSNQSAIQGETQQIGGQRLVLSNNYASNTGNIRIDPKESKGGKLISVQLDNANVFDVVEQLMSIYRKNYVLDLGPSSELAAIAPRVTAKLTGVTLDEFLRMLKKSSGIQVEQSGDQSIIRWRPDANAVLALWDSSEPLALYYLYFAVDPAMDLKDRELTNSIFPSLAFQSGMFRQSFMRRMPGKHIEPLLSGSVSSLSALASQRMDSLTAGPVLYRGNEIQASIRFRISEKNGSNISLDIRDELSASPNVEGQWNASENNSRIVNMRIGQTRVVRTGVLRMPDNNEISFALAVTVAREKKKD